MADSKDKDLEETNPESSPEGGQELSAEELAAIARWQAMAASDSGDDEAAEDMVLSQPEPIERVAKPRKPRKEKAPKKVAGATIVDEIPDPVEEDRGAEEGIGDAFAEASEPTPTVEDNGLGDEFAEAPLASAAEPDPEAADEPSSSRADDRDASPKEDVDETIPPSEELRLVAVPGTDLSLQDPSSDDRQGLMRWDEAINLEAQVEAIIFAAPKPISMGEIAELLADDDGIEPSHSIIDNHIQQLQRLYKERSGGFRLEYDKGSGFQFRTVPAAAPLMERMFSSRQRPLSRAAHETLAIIAYRQPCTRADIEFIRGVDAGSIIKNLLERDLVACVGRKEDSGRPMLFGTTSEFLRVFRIQTLNDLPPLSAFQPATEAMISAFQKIDSPEDSIDVEGFIGDEDRDPIDVTHNQLAEFAASGSGIDVREDALETASHPAQIRRAGGSYDNEGYSRDDGFEDTEVAIGSGDSIAPGGGEDAAGRPDHDQRPSRERTGDED